MGQGDNQVLVLSYPKAHPVPVSERHAAFINTQLSHFGPPLKLKETWSSCNVLTYGKVIISLGVSKSTSIKKLYRAARLTNDGVATLSSTLSSIAANVSSVTCSDNDPIVPFIIGLETIGKLRLDLQHPMYSDQSYQLFFHDRIKVPLNGLVSIVQLNFSQYDTKVVNHLALLSITPSILGGYPAVQIQDLINHGHPDPLSSAIWSLKTLYESLPDSRQYFKDKIINILSPIYLCRLHMLCCLKILSQSIY